MRGLTFTARAQADLLGVRTYLEARNPAAARELSERLVQACLAPTHFEAVGRVGRRRGTRELTTVPPYVIVYRVSPETISIERIIHGARRR